MLRVAVGKYPHIKVGFVSINLRDSFPLLPPLPCGANRAYKWGNQIIADSKNGKQKYLLLNGGWVPAYPVWAE